MIDTPALPAPNATLHQAARWGDLIFVSGQLGIDPSTGALVAGGQVAEYRQALENIQTILTAAGTTLAHVVKTTVYMTNVDELTELNKLYAQYFPHAPAKTGVEVRRLSMGAQIEIEVVAGSPHSDAA
jgi:2-iminobutanoate/2-iminopropanoate deaminase